MALRWFAGMAARMEQDMRPYLVPTIGALYRISDSKEKAEEAIKNTATEVRPARELYPIVMAGNGLSQL